MNIIDLRDPASFAKGYLEGAINIPYGPAFFAWAKMFLQPADTRTIVYPDNLETVPLRNNLNAFDPNCDFTFIPSQELHKHTLIPLTLIDAHALDLTKHTIVDVRGPNEWSAAFIEGAIPLELSKLSTEHQKIPTHLPIAVICASGTRSSIAASFLLKCGFPNVSSVKGGMNALT